MIAIRTVLTGLFLGAAMTAVSAQNTDQNTEPQNRDKQTQMADAKAARYATGLHLAYIRSDGETLNRVMESGLLNLALELGRRSTIEPMGVAGVDLENDDLSAFPQLYWQINANTRPLSRAAQNNLQKFIDSKRLLIIDMQPVQTLPGQPTHLRRILGDVQIPQPFGIVKGGHTLTHGLYMLDGLPGTRNDAHVLSNGTATRPGTVIIGQNRNWAQAWAGVSLLPNPEADEQGSVPHEQAMRAGINMIVTALGGNMRDDALHQETIRAKREQQAKPTPKAQ